MQTEYPLSDAKTKMPSKWISKTQHIRKKCDYLIALLPQFLSRLPLEWNFAACFNWVSPSWILILLHPVFHTPHHSRLPAWRLQDLPRPISEPLWSQFCCLGYPIFPLLCSAPVLWLANFYLWTKTNGNVTSWESPPPKGSSVSQFRSVWYLNTVPWDACFHAVFVS